MKRILLFLATNLAVGLVLTVVLSLLGVDRYLAGSGLNVTALAIYSVVVGFARATRREPSSTCVYGWPGQARP